MKYADFLKLDEDKRESAFDGLTKSIYKELESIGYTTGDDIGEFVEKTAEKLNKKPEKSDVKLDPEYIKLKRTTDRLEKEKADLETNSKVLSEKLSTIETQTKHGKIKGELDKLFRNADGTYKFYSAEEKIEYLISKGEVDLDSTGALVGLKDGKAIPSADWYKGYEELKKADIRVDIKGGRGGSNTTTAPNNAPDGAIDADYLQQVCGWSDQ